jgi:hypothetical protein
MRSAGSDTESWEREYTSEGKRLAFITDTHHASPTRVKLIENWLNACRQRIAASTAWNQATIDSPLQYVSYALKASNESPPTNWFIELIKAACAVTFEARYSFQMFTICLIPIEPLGPWIQVLLSRFMRAYATDGGFGTTWPGLRPKPSGRSTAQQVTYMQETNTWISATTPMDANAKIELACRTAYRIAPGPSNRKGLTSEAALTSASRNKSPLSKRLPKPAGLLRKTARVSLDGIRTSSKGWTRRMRMPKNS